MNIFFLLEEYLLVYNFIIRDYITSRYITIVINKHNKIIKRLKLK